jgi:uncharacterized protein (DUF305 family)
LTRVRRLCVVFAASLAAAACQRAASDPAKAAPPPVQAVQPGAPGEPSKDVAPGTAAAPVATHTRADVRFMQEMIHHHAQAIEMVALLKTRTKRPDLKMLGERIDVSQTDEIKMMKTWLTDRGEEVPMDHGRGQMMMQGAMMSAMPGMLSSAQMAALEKASGPAFDRLFLTGMIQHHEGALAMVEALLKSPGAALESVIFDFISHVDADQRMEISRMRLLLARDQS